MSAPICPYCNQPSKRVTGAVVYPHRRDLADKVIYQCAPCDAHVGCHPGTSTPLGRLANAELRVAKQRAHAAFDPLWRTNFAKGMHKFPTRGDAYRWLAKALGLHTDECHIGMFDVTTCDRVVAVCRESARAERVPA